LERRNRNGSGFSNRRNDVIVHLANLEKKNDVTVSFWSTLATSAKERTKNRFYFSQQKEQENVAVATI
jgi:hypothetical protein